MSSASHFAFLPAGEDLEQRRRKLIDGWREDGISWMRFTAVNRQHEPLNEGGELNGIWLEGWLERPTDEGEFNPPLTIANRDTETPA